MNITFRYFFERGVDNAVVNDLPWKDERGSYVRMTNTGTVSNATWENDMEWCAYGLS